MIVVGGGAAGLVAAITAARCGAAVTVLERMPRVGKKLLATGNGRCNFANASLQLHRYHGRDPGFAAAALAAFDLDATLRFFADLGIAAREEDGGKIFPRSGQASSVLDVLRFELARLGVETRCEMEVTRLARRHGAWEVTTRAGNLRGDAVVLTGGGRASPQLGSNGSGYVLAQALGHRLVPPFPALTRIRVASPFLKHLKGVKVDGVASLVLLGPDRRRSKHRPPEPGYSASGEILFTETGLSGPPILDLSRRVGERAQHGDRTLMQLDICPEFAAGDLEAILRERFAGRRSPGGDKPGPDIESRSVGEGSIPARHNDSHPLGAGFIPAHAAMSAELALVGFLHKRLIIPVLKEAGIADTNRPAASLGEPEVAAVATVLKGWRFEVTGTDSWTDAQVAAGGVATADVSPATLESRIAPGLFLAGEVLDIDGDCGGFNLQWAWSSGRLAGTKVAECALKHLKRAADLKKVPLPGLRKPEE